MIRSLALTLLVLLGAGSLARADDHWPNQPMCWPKIHPSCRTGDCFRTGGVWFNTPSVHVGQLFPGRGLFFKTRADLDLFLGPHHALGATARLLTFNHPLIARDTFDISDVGGRVHDELFGDGFIMRPLNSEQQTPAWDEALPTSSRISKRQFVRHSGRSPVSVLTRGGVCCADLADKASNEIPFEDWR